MEDQLVPFNDHLETCKNCDNQFEAEYNFCPYCGQQANDNLTVGVLFYNTISNYFSFDARFIRSIVPLMLRPGYIAKEFVEGKRLRYLHPAQYYLFVSVFFFFIFSFKVREYNESVDKVLQKGFEAVKTGTPVEVKSIDTAEVRKITEPILNSPLITNDLTEEELEALNSTVNDQITQSSKERLNFSYNTNALDSLMAINAPEEEQLKLIGMKDNAGFLQRTFYRQILKFHKQRGGGIVQVFVDSIPIALFFLLPIFALILKIFYLKKGRFAHHLVFSFYYFSFLFIVLGVVISTNHWLFDIPDWLDWLIMLSTFVYLWLGLRRFYQQSYFLSLVKSGVITFLYMMFIVPAALVIIALSSILFY